MLVCGSSGFVQNVISNKVSKVRGGGACISVGLGGLGIVALTWPQVDTVLDVLRLRRCENTVVGNEFVRGVSGGEKRRLTIGEMLVRPKVVTVRCTCIAPVYDDIVACADGQSSCGMPG
jgi:hypothetical protein